MVQLDTPSRASKLSAGGCSSVENLVSACDDASPVPLASRSMPDISQRDTESPEKRSWELLGAPSAPPGTDENSLSLLGGLIDLYGMHTSLPG